MQRGRQRERSLALGTTVSQETHYCLEAGVHRSTWNMRMHGLKIGT